jgi:putative ABC transport system permease protein
MFKHYLKSALINIKRNKGYSWLNILGLGIGMAVTLIIGLWVSNECLYDKFLPDYKQLYQIRLNFYGNGDIINYKASSLKLADALRNQIPEFEFVAETDYFGNHGLMVDDKKLYLSGGQTATVFLKIFKYSLISGDINTALEDPYSIVLTESTAKALFGTEDAMHKTIRFDNKNVLTVTGILKDLPKNSTLQFNYLVPFSYYEANDEMVKIARNRNFNWNGFQIFVKLKTGVSYELISSKIKDIEKTEPKGSFANMTDVVLQPIQNWHLYNKFVNGKEVGGFIKYVYMFSIIGILVLMIACINFVNLTTARSDKRAKEVGIRKAIGSRKKDLIVQFLTESMVLTFFSFIFSLLLVYLSLPAFNIFFKSSIRIPFSNPLFWIITLVIVFLISIAAGSKPAFYLSAFNTITVLKGIKRIGKSSTLPRKFLVVVQFTSSVSLIIGTLIIFQQIQYAKDRPTGFNLDRLMMTDMNSDLVHSYLVLKNELIQKGIIESITTASCSVTSTGGHRDVDNWPGKQAGMSVNMGRINVSEDYFKTLGMSIKEGRDFWSNSDTMNVVCNEAAIKLMQIENPLNKVITYLDVQFTIVGIVKDALTVSPFLPPDPTIYFYKSKPQNVVIYRLTSEVNIHDAISELTKMFGHYNSSVPYDYQFADASYAAKFNQEEFIGKLAALFAGLAIFISCLGLFGLSAYISEQRTKEIGVRKVFGASLSQIWSLVSLEFIMLVLISCVIASPIAFHFLHSWLRQYDYHISIGIWVFIVAAITALVISIFTVSYQVLKVAMSNPVKSIQSE